MLNIIARLVLRAWRILEIWYGDEDVTSKICKALARKETHYIEVSVEAFRNASSRGIIEVRLDIDSVDL